MNRPNLASLKKSPRFKNCYECLQPSTKYTNTLKRISIIKPTYMCISETIRNWFTVQEQMNSKLIKYEASTKIRTSEWWTEAMQTSQRSEQITQQNRNLTIKTLQKAKETHLIVVNTTNLDKKNITEVITIIDAEIDWGETGDSVVVRRRSVERPTF